MSLDWNHNGKLDAADFLITELLEKELEEKKKQQNQEDKSALSFGRDKEPGEQRYGNCKD